MLGIQDEHVEGAHQLVLPRQVAMPGERNLLRLALLLGEGRWNPQAQRAALLADLPLDRDRHHAELQQAVHLVSRNLVAKALSALAGTPPAA